MWRKHDHLGKGSCLCGLVALTLPVWSAAPAAAEIIVHAGDAQATEAGTGFFDVFFEVHGGPYDLQAYMLELSVSDAAGGVTLTHVGEPENALFPGRTGNPTPGRPALPGPTLAVWEYFPTVVPLTDGAGLLRVYVETAPGSTGQYEVTIDPSLLRTNFSNGTGQLLSDLTTVGFASGRLDVVPEPSVAWLLAALVATAAVLQVSRRRRWR